MKKLIKENKVLFALSIIILISLICIGVGLISYFYSEDGDKYGNRLDGIENYPISDNIDDDIKSLYESGVQTLNVDIRGKVIYIIMDVTAGVSKADAQSMAVRALEKFTDEQKSFYDISFLITCKGITEETTMYPMQGMKNSENSQIVWTNN